MAGEQIWCQKCGRDLPYNLCPADDCDERCTTCGGSGFIVECKPCHWYWSGERMPPRPKGNTVFEVTVRIRDIYGGKEWTEEQIKATLVANLKDDADLEVIWVGEVEIKDV